MPPLPATMSEVSQHEGRIKGAAFCEFLRWYGECHGAGPLRTAAAMLDPAQRGELSVSDPRLGVIASAWYPATLVHALLDNLTRDLSAEERQQLAFEGAAAVMDKTLHGIYSVLFRWMATPERYARHASKLWQAYYDEGRFEVVLLGRRSSLASIRDWQSHQPLLCELNWGAAAAIHRAMGLKQVIAERRSCVAHGAPECRFVTSWSE